MSILFDVFEWYFVKAPGFYLLILRNYLSHIYNIFGIPRHVRTLFVPWKRLVTERKTRGLDAEDIIGVISYNIISSVIGAIIRTATILTGFISIVLFIVAWIEALLLWLILFPISPLFYLIWSESHPNLKKLFDRYQHSLKLLANDMGKDIRVKEVFIRLSLSEEAQRSVVASLANANYLGEIDIDLAHIHTKSSLLLRILQYELNLDIHHQTLVNHLITKTDLNNLFAWITQDEEDRYHDGRFWTKAKLQESRSIGKDWAFGYTPTLDRYAVDVARSATQKYEYNIHPEVMLSIEETFSQPRATSILLSGPPGIGKKTLVYFLAKRIFDGMTTVALADHRVMVLDMDAVLAASESAEQKNLVLEQLLAEAHNAGNIILVIENIDQYVRDAKIGTNLSSVLSTVGSDFNVKLLMTTTHSKFRQTVRADNLFLASVNTIHIEPLSDEKTIVLLLHLIKNYESKHQFFTYRGIKEIVKYADDVYSSVPQPAASIRAMELVLAKRFDDNVITSDDVDLVFSQQTSSVVGKLSKEQKDKLLELKQTLSESIIGQDEALSQLTSALKRSQLQLTKNEKTMGAFLFLGATGVGKTETAKTLAKVMFGNPENLVRVDCAEYVTEGSLSGLIGSHDGSTVGLLTEAVRKEPYSVVLLDEIEKAHRSIRLALMTVFDEGYLQDGKGERISFKHTVIISTSNAGSEYLYKNLDQNLGSEELIEYLVQENILKPEFINRFDGVVVYNPLSFENIVEIAKLKLKGFSEKLMEEKSVKLEISDETFEQLFKEGYSQKFGARYLERAINKIVIDRVADELLAENVGAGQILKI